MAQSVSELSLGPTKAVTSWLTDQIAPAYWRPNSQILSCSKCAASFKDNDTKHHCRACGEGFCDGCSSKTRPVPERGWGPVPVRVCDNCYEARNVQLDVTEAQADEEGGTLIARKVGEAVQNTLGAVVTAIDIPLGGPGSASPECSVRGMKGFRVSRVVVLSKAGRARLSWTAGS
ncbi:zinc finger FYVE-type containing 1 [Phyllostomus discolor]|uniref:Zinc finger FYVE-type containing 1 n=1 Tax=Phyllostomus discolor TaxID=89673 RepID=A0A834BTF1_9CHIR|nr:zinc finger FYVE-type containing 1 [Phyllostomus discolor]